MFRRLRGDESGAIETDPPTELEQSELSSDEEPESAPAPQEARNFNKLWAGALCVIFLLYMVKIGRDEMKWYRLYLPVFPLLLALSGDGLRWLSWGSGRLFARDAWDAPGRSGHRSRTWLFLPWVPVVLVLAFGLYKGNDELLDQKAAWHNRYVESSEKTFQAMGRYISKLSLIHI